MQFSVWNKGESKPFLLQYALIGIFGLLSVICLLAAVLYVAKSTQTNKPIEFVIGEASVSAGMEQKAMITVDVSGGVNNPGVYQIPAGSRVHTVIEKAGGLSREASRELIEKSMNQASKVNDGAKIYIPKKTDEETSHNESATQIYTTNSTSHNILSSESGMNTININAASQSELETLSGIGPATATKIIHNRPYKNIDELVSKKVVGQKLLEQIRAQLSL